MKTKFIFLSLCLTFNAFAWEEFKALDGNNLSSASGGAVGFETEAATPSSGSCPETRKDWLRVTKSSENATKYFKTQQAEVKINAGGKSNVEIYAIGCEDGDQKFNSTDADIKGDSAFPDNIVIPVKANSEILDVAGIKSEADLNAGMLKFINSAKKKIKEGYVIDDTKEIVVYATATAVAPSCGAENGYDSQIMKSFDNTKQISNSELAYKRALNAAKLIKKLLVDPTVNDSGSKLTIKIKAYCSINVGTVPTLKVFGMLKKGEHVEKMNKIYNCGDEIAINGGVGMKAPPAWPEEKFTEFSIIENSTNPTLSIQVPNSDTKGTDGKSSWVTEITKYEWRSCYDTVMKKTGENTYSGTSGKSFTFKSKKIANNVDECRLHSCEAYFLANKDTKVWSVPEMIYCSKLTQTGQKNRSKPGDFQVTADDTKDYTIAWNDMSFKKGERLRLNFDAVYVPDRFIVTVGGKRIIDTGYVSCVIDDTNRYHTGLANLVPPQPVAERGNYYARATPIVGCPSIPNGVTGTKNGVDYIFPKDTPGAKVKLHVFGPYGTTIWRAQVSCPDKDKAESTLVTDIKTKYGIK